MNPGPPIPRINHVALSVGPDLLAEPARGELLGFYEEVFGWTEMVPMTIEGEQLVLRVHSNEQFVFLCAKTDPMRCDPMDHFGISVETPADLDRILERARARAQSDSRIEIRDRTTEDFQVLRLHGFYLRFLLPMMVEVQCFEWAEGIGPFTTM